MACPFSKFCLGMCDWTNCPGLSMETTPATDKTQPISASHSLSSSHTSTSSSALLSDRFSAFFSDDEYAVLSKGVVSANTDNSTNKSHGYCAVDIQYLQHGSHGIRLH